MGDKSYEHIDNTSRINTTPGTIMPPTKVAKEDLYLGQGKADNS